MCSYTQKHFSSKKLQTYLFVVLFLYRYPGKSSKVSSRKNPYTKCCGIARFECYKLNELLSSHMNNKSCVHGYKEYDYEQWPT